MNAVCIVAHVKLTNRPEDLDADLINLLNQLENGEVVKKKFKEEEIYSLADARRLNVADLENLGIEMGPRKKLLELLQRMLHCCLLLYPSCSFYQIVGALFACTCVLVCLLLSVLSPLSSLSCSQERLALMLVVIATGPVPFPTESSVDLI